MENDSGFSFGARPNPPGVPGPFEEPDAIEVSGEPVSRSEAQQMGLNISKERDGRDAKASTNILRMDQLPPDLNSDLARKMETAWEHLKRNEIEQALTLAQEVVWQYPALVAAKLIIARCFINRKEYDKALAILQAISENEMSGETMYYIGLCQSRLGRIPEALSSLQLARVAATDSAIKKRANELIQHLQGEQTVCPVCGKKTLYDSMVEVGNRTVCADCADAGNFGDDDEDDEGEEDEEMEYAGKKRRRKRLRPPLTKTDIILRVILFLIILVGGMAALYFLSPSVYATIRSYLPASWTFIPLAHIAPEQRPGGPVQPVDTGPRIIPTLAFDSPPLERAIVGVETRHQLAMDAADTPHFSVRVTPEPTGEYSLDADSGLFTWLPAEDDAGRVYTIAFDATFQNYRSPPQVNRVKVLAGAAYRRLGDWPGFDSDDIGHILVENLSGQPGAELILVAGKYHDGHAAIYHPGAESDALVSQVRFQGRPVGAGVILADSEKWLAVADYWQSRLRHFAYRDGSLAEMAVTIDLPGRPIMAGFCMEDSVSAVLCRVGGEMKVIAYRQLGQLDFKKLGEWSVPVEFVWRRLLVFKAEDREGQPVIVLTGAAMGPAFLVMEPGRDEYAQPFRGEDMGMLVDAVAAPDARLVHCLIDKAGTLSFLTVGLDREQKMRSSLAGPAPALGGLCALRGSGGNTDLMLFNSKQVGVSFGGEEGMRGDAFYWPLPSPPVLFGRPAVLAGDNGEEAVFAGCGGELWSVRLSDD